MHAFPMQEESELYIITVCWLMKKAFSQNKILMKFKVEKLHWTHIHVLPTCWNELEVLGREA